MKKWVVASWVDGEISDSWEFDDKAECYEFYRKKARNLNRERIEENRQLNVKFDNDEEWGYTREDTENNVEEFRAFKKWRGVKEERLKNED